ncbi:HSP20 family protein [Catalinimonas alkaloidigena]|uniref:Hsp20/alpha crystallin family protein n=1 Tax=Catalinimonas alkaloidigena TaxID=1075417 RepID=UPI002406BAC1|nr:Hsp20 family protein [Catalinimonas alkaloidigena]MDF9797501.1 HSP20 family protein [Catalinimonas alkaloidigena]
MRPHILHNGLHRIGDEPARFFDNERFLSRDPFDDLWLTRPETPPTNIKAQTDAYDLEIALPGFTKDEISIEVNNETLNIVAEKKEKDEGENKLKYIRREYNTKSLYRGFSIPKYVNKENIEASFENGLLKIRLPHEKQEQNNYSVNVE